MRTLTVVTWFCLEFLYFLLALSFPTSLSSRAAAFCASLRLCSCANGVCLAPTLSSKVALPSTYYAPPHPSLSLSSLKSPLPCAHITPPLFVHIVRGAPPPLLDDDDDAAVNKNNNINEYQEVLGKNIGEGVTKDNENFIDEKYATAVNENFNILLTERVTQELKRQTSFNVMKHLTESIMNDFKITVINELKEYIKSDLKETIISDDDDFKKNSHKRIKRKY